MRTKYFWLGLIVLCTVLVGCQQDTETETTVQATGETSAAETGTAAPVGQEPAVASGQVGADPDGSYPGPAINVSPASFDFGSMHQNQTRNAETFIKNVGTDTLNIQFVRPTCGCTAADLEVTSLAPGESTKLEITFNSKRFSGPVTKQVHIGSDDPANRQVTLMLSADVKVAVKVEPSQQYIANRSIPLGESWIEQVTFSTEEVPELDVQLESHNQDVMDVEIQNRFEGDPQKSVMIVKTHASLSPGSYNEVIKVKTNVQQTPSITISVRARMLGNLTVAPGSLSFGMVEGGQEIDGSVKVTASRKDLDFQVTRAEIDIPDLDVSIEPGGSSQEVIVHVSGTALTTDSEEAVTNHGRMMGFLNIYTDLPNEPVLKVRAFYMLRM